MKLPIRQTPYDIINNLEKNLRELIKIELSSITPNWWKQRIPDDVKKNAKERKSKHEKNNTKKHHLVHYIDFSDYDKIISRNDNWNDVFVNVFSDKKLISSKLLELKPIRDSISHSRDLSRQEMKRLKFYSEEILLIIKNYKKKTVNKKSTSKSWLKIKPLSVIVSTSSDRTVYSQNSVIYVRINTPTLLPNELMKISIYNSKKEKLAYSEINPETYENEELKSVGLYQTSMKMSGSKWIVGNEYYVIAKYGNAETFDSFYIDQRNPVIQSDKTVYMWGSDMILTVIDPDADKDSQKPEFVGDSPDSFLTISSSVGKISGYKLLETGDSTGIFQGIIGLIGTFDDGSTIPYDLDGKQITKTQGKGIEDGFLKVKRGDEITVTYKRKSESTKLTAFTSNFGSVIELDQKIYKNEDKVFITIVAPDYNFYADKKDAIGTSKNDKITISTSAGKIDGYKLIETKNDSGTFIGSIQLSDFSKLKSSRGSGPDDGILPARKDDFLEISFNYFGQEKVIGRALIK